MGPMGMEPTIRLHVTNKSAVPVSISEVGLWTARGSWPEEPVNRQDGSAALPSVIPPKETTVLYLRRTRDTSVGNQSMRIDLIEEAGVQFYVLTSDSRRFMSSPIRKRPESVEHVRHRRTWGRN
jgi:hypothetical protein